MVDWRDRLLPASFRGIPFFLDTHDFTGGRNALPHEPPDRKSSFSEDLGRRSQVFSIEGHVLGDTYSFTRDALIDAMESKEKGILIHPYLGVQEVRPGQFTFTESTTEGRIARFSLQFIEAGDPSFPVAAIDTVTDFLTDVVATVAVAQNAFQVAFSVALLPGFVVESAVAILEDFSSDVRTSARRTRLKAEEQAELFKQLDDLDENSETLVRNPASLIFDMDGIISGMKDVVDDAFEDFTIDIDSGRDDTLDIFTDINEFTPTEPVVDPNTPSSQSQADNTNALINAIKQLSLIRLAENALVKEFDSIESAIIVRDRIIDLIEEQLLFEGLDDELFSQLEQFKAKVNAVIPSGNLPNIETIDVKTSIPAIVLSYDRYESDEQESDIIERNAIENPAFVSGTLEVLSG